MNIIDKGIARIKSDGWWQDGGFGSGRDTAGVCLVLAVSRETEWDEQDQKRAAWKAIADELGLPSDDVAGLYAYNDDPSTSEEDVILLMKKASARLDELQGVSA